MTVAKLNVDELARTVCAAAAQSPRRYLVAIGGIPGSGKSTVAYPLVRKINELLGSEVAIGIGADGWHYSQDELRAMPEPTELFARRGAHYTFDGAAYVSFIRALDKGEAAFPTFSHADKDPVLDGGRVDAGHKIIIIEGLHCLLDLAPWNEVAGRYDERIWVDVPLDVARTRIVRRHLQDGVESSLEAATRRADESDILNAKLLLDNLIPPTATIAEL